MNQPYQSHLQPFTEGTLPPEAFKYQRYMDVHGMSKADAKRVVEAFKRERVFLNDVYQVNIQPPASDRDPFIHLSIKRRDKAPIHDWRDLQAIKNMLVGPDHEAVELYPAESRLVDTANQYHLWALKEPGRTFAFGFPGRMVIGHGIDGAVQRPLPEPVQPAEQQTEAEKTSD